MIKKYGSHKQYQLLVDINWFKKQCDKEYTTTPIQPRERERERERERDYNIDVWM